MVVVRSEWVGGNGWSLVAVLAGALLGVGASRSYGVGNEAWAVQVAGSSSPPHEAVTQEVLAAEATPCEAETLIVHVLKRKIVLYHDEV